MELNKPKLCQYIFVPKKPKMSPGKIASQVSKAAYLIALRGKDKKLKEEWILNNGMCTLVLQVKDQIELHNVKHYLSQENITHISYNDEGYTEVPPGTMTAIVLGIIDKEKEGWRFDKYKLYK